MIKKSAARKDYDEAVAQAWKAYEEAKNNEAPPAL
jgi:hypothetical protein